MLVCTSTQVNVFDLSQTAPDPMVLDLSAAGDFTPKAVRVVSADSASTTLLVGGRGGGIYYQYQGVVLYGIVAAGSAVYNVTGSAVLQTAGTGVTELSQTSLLQHGYVLAGTDEGVFKCGPRLNMYSHA